MSAAGLMARLEGACDAFVLAAVLQPVDRFVELAGEEFRKRLFLTEAADGTALCLRPEFTIPVCLEHLRAGREIPSIYGYRGNIFRKHRRTGAPEFEQAGTEWIGHRDEIATDAAVFALALECADAVGLVPQTRAGDAHIFAAVVEALGLPVSWQGRLIASFGDDMRLGVMLRRLKTDDGADGLAARLAPALAHVDAAQARAIVDAVVGLPQHGANSRSAADIAERLLEQADGRGADPKAAGVIERFLTIEAPLAGAAAALSDFAGEVGLDLTDAIAAFAARTDALRAVGAPTEAITFQARFGRRLSYYTGFVFEMAAAADPRAEVIAGGRYDKLIALLDPGRALPATGFSVWLDRLPEAS